MSITTLAAALPQNSDPEYAAGRADAYDDTRNRALSRDEVAHRASVIAEHHPSLPYALGYNDILLEQRQRKNLEAETAWVMHTKATR